MIVRQCYCNEPFIRITRCTGVFSLISKTKKEKEGSYTFNAFFDTLQSKCRRLIVSFPETLLFLFLFSFHALLLLPPRAAAPTAAPLRPAIASPCWWLLRLWSIITIKCLSSENASSSNINWPLNTIQTFHVDLYHKAWCNSSMYS